MLETVRPFFEPPYVYAVGAAGVVLLVGLILLARYFNRRYVILRRSAGTDQIAFELARIANALETMAARHRGKPALHMPGYQSSIGLSMFGR